MHPVTALTRLGGVAPSREVLRLTGRRRLARAVRRGTVLRLSRGRYALPTASEARRAAGRLHGVVGLRSAAAHHGWPLKTQPEVPEVIVPRHRKVVASRRSGVRVLWINLADDQVADGVTTPFRTVIDCARLLPFDEALAVADSALRSGLVTREELDAIDVRGAGAAAVRRVLRHADARAANPFESVLRALCLEAGLAVEPQAEVVLGQDTIHPDLVCSDRTAVIEGDSWTWHATRKAHGRDCARYNLLGIHGWAVYRFTWEQAMLDQGYVRWVLARLAERVGRAEVRSTLARPA
jgi:very-short-patch-repair endonuclease